MAVVTFGRVCVWSQPHRPWNVSPVPFKAGLIGEWRDVLMLRLWGRVVLVPNPQGGERAATYREGQRLTRAYGTL